MTPNYKLRRERKQLRLAVLLAPVNWHVGRLYKRIGTEQSRMASGALRVSFRDLLLLLPLLIAGFTIGQAGAQDDSAAQFLGMWKLVSWEQHLADGTTRQAPNSVGYIIYNDTGHMCYVGMNPDRPKWKSLTPTESEALSGIMGMGAYCATVEVDAGAGFVLHRVEIERVPNNVGVVRKRWFTFHGFNRLSLRIDTPELIAPIVESTLTWERITK